MTNFLLFSFPLLGFNRSWKELWKGKEHAEIGFQKDPFSRDIQHFLSFPILFSKSKQSLDIRLMKLPDYWFPRRKITKKITQILYLILRNIGFQWSLLKPSMNKRFKFGYFRFFTFPTFLGRQTDPKIIFKKNRKMIETQNLARRQWSFW